MSTVSLNDGLRAEYQRLFDTCDVRPGAAAEVDRIVAALATDRARYASAAEPVGAPWYFVAVIHNMEASRRFDRHLHNGDPLTARTRQVPKGRPTQGSPPFTWEESAADALRLKRLDRWAEWTLPGTLYLLEGYNGWGYRRYHPHVLSPYLWSGSNHYTSGKYVADGRWSDTAVSKQIGAAVLLRRMAERGIVVPGGELAALQPAPAARAPARRAVADPLPALRYSSREIPHAAALQAFLNGFPDIYLKVDGKPGKNTSDAFRAVTGHYLKGDPRA